MASARRPAGTSVSSSSPAGRRAKRATMTATPSPAAMPPVDASPPAPPPCTSAKSACPPTSDAAATAAAATATTAGSRARRTARSAPAPTPSTMARPWSATATWVPPRTRRSAGSTPSSGASRGPRMLRQVAASRRPALQRHVSPCIDCRGRLSTGTRPGRASCPSPDSGRRRPRASPRSSTGGPAAESRGARAAEGLPDRALVAGVDEGVVHEGYVEPLLVVADPGVLPPENRLRQEDLSRPDDALGEGGELRVSGEVVESVADEGKLPPAAHVQIAL